MAAAAKAFGARLLCPLRAVASAPARLMMQRSAASTVATIAAKPSAAPITLASLADNTGAVKTKRRVGRGDGSGRGGTCGRGHKGQKARAGRGRPRVGFEGGQTPLHKRIPKRGFTNVHAKEYSTFNLDKLQRWIDTGRLDPTKPITMKELLDSRLVHSIKDGIKVLGDGAMYLRTPIHLEVSQASKSAIEAIEKCGGKIVTVYYNKLGLRALIKPQKFRILPRRAEPTSSRDIDYYADPSNRGYIALKATPTYPAPTARFYGGLKQPVQYTLPPMAPLKPTRKLLALRVKQKKKAANTTQNPPPPPAQIQEATPSSSPPHAPSA